MDMFLEGLLSCKTVEKYMCYMRMSRKKSEKVINDNAGRVDFRI